MRLRFMIGPLALLLLSSIPPPAHAQEAAPKDGSEARLEELRTRIRGLMKEIEPAAARLASLREEYADLGRLDETLRKRSVFLGEVMRLREEFISAREEFHGLGQAKRDLKVMAGLGQLMRRSKTSSVPSAFAYW